jgi:hypothetical protein
MKVGNKITVEFAQILWRVDISNQAMAFSNFKVRLKSSITPNQTTTLGSSATKIFLAH